MAKADRYDWSGGPPTIDTHSTAKHRLLDTYLRAYVRTLAQDPRRRGLRLTIVDGFAGGGLYRGPNNEELPGSPLIAMRAVDEAAAEQVAWRRDPFDVAIQYIFVERLRAAVAHLQKVMVDRPPAPGSTVRILSGTFEHHADAILAAAREHSKKAHRTIFILDQYGWNRVPMPIIQRIFREFEAPEVILTFSVDKLANTFVDTPGLRAAMHRFDPNVPFDEWVKRIEARGGDWRATIQHLLHDHFATAAGATFYTPFFIASAVSNLSYWLIHLSKHVRAKDVMTDTHWALGNCMEHDGSAGLDMFGERSLVMGFDPRKGDVGVAPALFQFDDRARALTLDALHEQLPRRIRDHHPNGVQVLDLYGIEANATPASTAHLREAIEGLVAARALVIQDEHGQATRAARVDDHTRVIVPRSAPLFHFRRT